MSGERKLKPISRAILSRFLAHPFHTVLDVGSGGGRYAKALRAAGKDVTTLDLGRPADLSGDFETVDLWRTFDAIWCSHVLEHAQNVDAFLTKLRHHLITGGVLCVVVPPARFDMVGGHISLWTEGLLVYRLVLAGFDCSKAQVGRDGYNLAVIVRKSLAVLPALRRGRGDIEALAPFFPVPVQHGMDGRGWEVNW